MEERELRHWIERVKDGTITRREFHPDDGRSGPDGAPGGPDAGGIGGVAQAQTKPAFTPTKRGGGGTVKVLWWQSPTLLNPHFANGTKDQDGSRIFYEPLASFDPDGNLMPILAAEIPTVQNGGVAKDGTSVTWKLKQNVQWHDGKPFTADDVVFNWEYATDPATAAVTVGRLPERQEDREGRRHTVKVTFSGPSRSRTRRSAGRRGQIIPKHVFEAFKGAKSREAPANLKPVGTGAYKYRRLQAGGRGPGGAEPELPRAQPALLRHDRAEGRRRRGVGGARGHPDRRVRLRLEHAGRGRHPEAAGAGRKGRINIALAGNIEHIQLNITDPWTEVDGERSSVKSEHPFLTDPAVRQALALLVDRGSVQEQLYGRQGQATANFLNAPSKFSSKNNKWELNLDKADQILEAAGWKKGPDGIRAKDGKKLKMVYQTSINAVRQKTQAIVKQAAAKAGIEIELKSVMASVFFASDPGQLGHLPPLRDRHPDVHDHHDAARSSAPHGPVHLLGGGVQGEQVARAQPDPVAERGVRPALEGGRGRDGSRQARGHVHPDERPRDPERGRDSRSDGARRSSRSQQAEGHRHQRVGFGPGKPGVWHREA